MSKQNEKTQSTKVESVKADSSETSDQVFEGEVVTETIDDKIVRGRAYSDSKASSSAESDQDKGKSDKSDTVKPSVTMLSWRDKMRKVLRYGMWALIIVAVIAAFIFTRPNTDWQVQHINDLQTEVAQLHQGNRALEARLNAQDELIDQRVSELVAVAMEKPENQSIVTKADLETLQQASEQQITQLQESLTTLKDQVSTQVDKAVTEVSDFAAANQDALQPTAAQLAALNQLEEKVQSQLSEIGGKLSELFDFKSSQQAQPEQTAPAGFSEKLSLIQIQNWIVELNTQWLLKGNEEMTKQQLLALEQAVVVSKIKDATSLTRLLGQDLAYLTQLKTASVAQPFLETLALRDAINALKIQKDSATESSDTTTLSTAPSSEVVNSESAFEQLKDRLSDMIRVKKREDTNGQTQVESLLLQDVLIQRALLLVDRIDWAIQSQSQSLLKTSIIDFQQFIDQYFATHSTDFSRLLMPFSEVTFIQKKSLAITQFQVSE